jgi:lysozyme
VTGVPKTAIELAKRFEGFHRVPKTDPGRAHPYICPAGYWTIGYGHLCEPTHPPITEAEAEVYLARDLQTALAATLRYCPVLAAEPEGRLSAIVDFTFNLGANIHGAAADVDAGKVLRRRDQYLQHARLSTGLNGLK